MAQILLRDYLQETEDAISSGRINEALDKCQYILAYFPESLEAQRLLGEVYLAQGNLEEAQHAFDWVLTNDPENVITYCDRALISERMSDYDTALDCYQQAYELSRGNSQIRQQFNQLSMKVGQQGFMFSRAGLARLYMRGDLLSQAIQEWEVVLTGSPDRLDARLGLLETYWREGMYDRVEQLATATLRDVPTCLKALLLLAYTISSKNIQQAQELLSQAEALDPDLFMAQDLFGDITAGRPEHPFLQLLKKSPVFLEPVNGSVASNEEEAFVMPESMLDTQQNSLVGYDNLSGQSTTTDEDPWSVLDRMVHSQDSQDLHVDSWQLSHEPTDAADATFVQQQAALEQHVWDSADQPTMLNFENVEAWDDMRDAGTTATKEEEVPTPPAWLNLLTQSEGRQPSGATPVLPSSSVPFMGTTQDSAEPKSSRPSWNEEPQDVLISQRPIMSPQPSWEEPQGVPSASERDEEPFFFGPEWLKSLGATAIDDASPAEPAYGTVPTASPVEPPSVSTMPLARPEPQQEAVFDLDEWISQIPEPEQEAEQSFLTTLEDLEHNLRSQGFIPLEPNSLSAIAHVQQTAPSPTEPSSVPSPAVFEAEETYREPTLSSALAQLGNLTPQSAPGVNPSVTPAVPAPPVPVASTQQTREQTVPTPEALWASLRPVPAPSPVPTVSQEPPKMPPARVNALPNPVFNKVPAAPTETSFDSELETTVKRPVVRLQAMQQPAVQQEPSAPAKRIRSGERTATSKTVDSNMSYRERLIKGYQHQLVGDYDEAMHEYRILIRSAPELLSEVVSNVRALLKLAPKYSAGYRVLGDAYMRQGEYLQAMEAYNKALAMAKRTKI